jgi:hypothetical protein
VVHFYVLVLSDALAARLLGDEYTVVSARR